MVVWGDLGYIHDFMNVEVRVGDNDYSQEFNGNELLMYYEGKAEFQEIVTFKREKPLRGRYVSVLRFHENQYLIITQMKIIVI